MNKVFKEWLMLLPWQNKSCPCPSCGEQAIDYRLIGDIDKNVGWAMIWCERCKVGIHVSRMQLPSNAKIYSFEEVEENENILPQYKINLVQP